MSKALVIPGIDFSVNKLTTVTLIEPKPCSDISLNKSFFEKLKIGATEQLDATLTPENTTDTLVWSSSDINVATVVNGLVTTVGVGTAVITATCGIASSTCVVSSCAFMDGTNRLDYLAEMGFSALAEGSNGIVNLTSKNTYGCLLSSSGSHSIYNPINFPYVVPTGTKRIKVSFPTTSTIGDIYRIGYLNSEYTVTVNNVTQCAGIYKTQNPTMQVDQISGIKYYIDTIPILQDLPTIDSFIVCVRSIDPFTTDILQTDLDAVVVEFLPAET